MKLLRPFTGTGAIFFPVGRPPVGTCQFATDKCLATCYVNDPSDFDQETRVPTCVKQAVYRAVIDWHTWDLVRVFKRELDGLQTPILSWFGSGDCLEKDGDKISRIVEALKKAGVVQMSFTRNRDLWECHKDVFALTIEYEDEATDPTAMYSIPNYEKETSVMYCPSYEVRGGYCGPIVCQDKDRTRPELTHYINCRICHRLKMGCFDRREP